MHPLANYAHSVTICAIGSPQHVAFSRVARLPPPFCTYRVHRRFAGSRQLRKIASRRLLAAINIRKETAN